MPNAVNWIWITRTSVGAVAVRCIAVLTTALILTTTNVHAELVGYWSFDDTLDDSSGQGNTGTLIGDPVFDDDVSALLGGGRSMVFDGDDAVDLGNPDILNFGTSDFTIAAWAKKVGGSSRGNVYSNGGDNSGGVRTVLAIGESGGAGSVVLTLDDDTNKRQPRSGNPREAGFNPTSAPDDEWGHLVGLRAGNEARVYFNGVLGDLIMLPNGYDLSGMSQLPSYIGVGASANSNPIGAFLKWFTGKIDEVAIWNEALDDDFISFLSLGGAIIEAPTNPGDFNADGQLDMADFLIMAENFNESFPFNESFAKGDQTRDRKVDLADFLEIREIFNAAQPGALASVPEPSCLVLLGCGALCLLGRRRRR